MAGMAALVDIRSIRRIKCEPKECVYKRLVNKLIVTVPRVQSSKCELLWIKVSRLLNEKW